MKLQFFFTLHVLSNNILKQQNYNEVLYMLVNTSKYVHFKAQQKLIKT